MIQLIFTLVLVGFLIYFFILDGDKSKVPFLNNSTNKQNKNKANNKAKININKKNIKSTQANLPFKEIRTIGTVNDRALVVKKNNTYVGIIEIFGVNYNLLSIDERLVLEEVYQKMLNGLDYPIQKFIQSRSMDIENYEKIYTERLEEIKDEIKKEERKVSFSTNNDILEELNLVKRNIARLQRQLSYGETALEFIRSVSYNSDILDKKYFIATPYYYDRSLFNQEQTEEEKFKTAFNTINNRLESILQTLSGAGLEGKFLNGIEVAELLYTSFNKNESDKFKLRNAFSSGFSNLIITSKPVELKIVENAKRNLDEEIAKAGLIS